MQAERAPIYGVVWVVTAALLGSLAVDRSNRSRDARIAHQKAEAASAQAVRDALAAKAKLEEAIRQLDDLDARISEANDEYVTAQTDEARAAALARLERLWQERRQLLRRLQADRLLVARQERSTCVCISPDAPW